MYSQIDDNRVVWYGSTFSGSNPFLDFGSSEIFLYDISTGTTSQITNNSYDDFGPRIDGDKVIWAGLDGPDTEIFLATIIPPVPEPITVDIKPGSYPNCFNNDGHGVIPVAILDDAEYDVYEIDPATVELEGLSIKAAGKSNKLMAHYEYVDDDDFIDLIVQIEDFDGVFSEGDTIATITGNLFDGTPIQGTDSICIVP